MNIGDKVKFSTRAGAHTGYVLKITRSGLIVVQLHDELLYRKPQHVTVIQEVQP